MIANIYDTPERASSVMEKAAKIGGLMEATQETAVKLAQTVVKFKV